MSSCEYLPRTGHRHHADPRPGRGGPRGRGPLTCLAVPGPAVDLLHTLRGEPSDVATGAAFPEAAFADAQNCTGKGAGLVGGAWGRAALLYLAADHAPFSGGPGAWQSVPRKWQCRASEPLCLLGLGARMHAWGIPASSYLAAQGM